VDKKKIANKETMAKTKSKKPKPRASFAKQSRARSEKSEAEKWSLKKVLQQEPKFIKLDMKKKEDAKAAKQIIEDFQSDDAKEMREVIKESAADGVNIIVLMVEDNGVLRPLKYHELANNRRVGQVFMVGFGFRFEKEGPEDQLVIFQ
jgi:hypothetical protein